MTRLERRSDGKTAGAYRAQGERLDSRTLLSGITAIVDNTSDSVDQGSLRDSNQPDRSARRPDSPNSIVFRIPKSDPDYNPADGTFTIKPFSGLPQITRPVSLEGTSESASLGQPALVVVDGSQLKVADGLTLAQGSPGSTIDGLEIANFDGSGIVIQSSGNTIGGTASGAGNILGVKHERGHFDPGWIRGSDSGHQERSDRQFHWNESKRRRPWERCRRHQQHVGQHDRRARYRCGQRHRVQYLGGNSLGWRKRVGQRRDGKLHRHQLSGRAIWVKPIGVNIRSAGEHNWRCRSRVI